MIGYWQPRQGDLGLLFDSLCAQYLLGTINDRSLRQVFHNTFKKIVVNDFSNLTRRVFLSNLMHDSTSVSCPWQCNVNSYSDTVATIEHCPPLESRPNPHTKLNERLVKMSPFIIKTNISTSLLSSYSPGRRQNGQTGSVPTYRVPRTPVFNNLEFGLILIFLLESRRPSARRVCTLSQLRRYCSFTGYFSSGSTCLD